MYNFFKAVALRPEIKMPVELQFWYHSKN